MDLIDSAALDRLREFGGDKLLRGMIELFVRNAPKKVADARAALVTPSWPALDLRPCRAAFSEGPSEATSVHHACAAGEELAAKGDIAACEPHVVVLERDLPLACDALLTLRPAGA